jgi:hypothetical protein
MNNSFDENLGRIKDLDEKWQKRKLWYLYIGTFSLKVSGQPYRKLKNSRIWRGGSPGCPG